MPRNLKIEVRLRSASKAARNDPRPTPPPEYYISHVNEGLPDDTSDEMADGSLDDLSLASHSSKADIFAEFEWLEQIDGLIFSQDDSDSDEIQVGYCDGKLIRREDIRAKFRFAMEEPTEEICSLAFDLFDRYGRLKPEYKVHSIKKGSGIWNTELDDGDIFLIESLRIERKYRRLGQGSALVRAMLEMVRDKTLGFVTVVRPGVLCSELLCEPSGEKVLTKESSELAMDISKSFWRFLGFRRIGSSPWFGLASDPQHPCHRLAAESDYEIPALSSSMLDTELERKMKIALDSSDNDFVHFLSQVWGDAAGDDPRWTSTDADGNTVLHLAATSFKPNSIQWILRRDKVLLHRRNAHGETPLDALLASLEDSRTTRRFNALTEDISDLFSGFSDTAIDCLNFLNGGTEVTDVDWQRLKYGCTCGQCISGFLSPRMCFALECQADIWCDFLREDIQDGNFWVENNSTFLSFLPRRVRNDLKSNKSMRYGVMNLCGHIANCLRGHMIPNKPNVEMVLRDASEWPPTSRIFLQRGGSVGAVATMLSKRAMESDELAGDPLLMETFEDQIQQLPECRNDHEFGFVSGLCGYESVSAF
ncbi:hypothetical protein N7499_008649 [Penicillium canescens]|nr:hypothetical protein N7499_008649 [Penicillium canescens]KAJ6158977.1 hypothetical protein N7485_011803 [Penicillium canescens]